MAKQKTYPSSLHMYSILYEDGEYRTLYACGMTNAYAISREYWPNQIIKEIIQLDDTWKN